MAHILIVEDELAINHLIMKNLRLVGHTCDQVFDGAAAVDAVLTGHFDLVILDVMLPKLSGFEVSEQLKIADVPIIFVTARDGLNDRLKGLHLGDDYIVKPFEILELIARVEAVLRRTRGSDDTFAFDDILIDFKSKRVFRDDKEVTLTPKEYSLFETLVINRNLALTRDKLIALVWEFDYVGDTRTVDVHIQQLRTKLGLRDKIKTVYKVGYRLEL